MQELYRREPSALEGWILKIICCDPKGSRTFLRILCTEGRGVCLCWAHLKPKGPKGPCSLRWSLKGAGGLLTSKVPLCTRIFRALAVLQGLLEVKDTHRPAVEQILHLDSQGQILAFAGAIFETKVFKPFSLEFSSLGSGWGPARTCRGSL